MSGGKTKSSPKDSKSKDPNADKSKIVLVTVCTAFVIALAGAIYLSSKGIAAPMWLTLILTGGGWLMKSPLTGKKDDEKDDKKNAEDDKDDAPSGS